MDSFIFWLANLLVLLSSQENQKEVKSSIKCWKEEMKWLICGESDSIFSGVGMFKVLYCWMETLSNAYWLVFRFLTDRRFRKLKFCVLLLFKKYIFFLFSTIPNTKMCLIFHISWRKLFWNLKCLLKIVLVSPGDGVWKIFYKLTLFLKMKKLWEVES